MQMAPCVLLLDNEARSAALACTTTDNNTATHSPPSHTYLSRSLQSLTSSELSMFGGCEEKGPTF